MTMIGIPFDVKVAYFVQLFKHVLNVSASDILWMKAALFHFDGECWYEFYEWKQHFFISTLSAGSTL